MKISQITVQKLCLLEKILKGAEKNLFGKQEWVKTDKIFDFGKPT